MKSTEPSEDFGQARCVHVPQTSPYSENDEKNKK